jgi:uncharacterized membrane protein (UPF0127 family)
MAFALDVIYLDREHKVVHLEHDLHPWHFAPVRLQAASVLELPSQTIAQTQTAIGDKIEIGRIVSA